MYKIGESVMYPKEGACYISGLVTKDINHHIQKYYELTVIYNSNLKISIPVLNADKIGVRPIMDENEVENFIQSLDKVDCLWVFDEKNDLNYTMINFIQEMFLRL